MNYLPANKLLEFMLVRAIINGGTKKIASDLFYARSAQAMNLVKTSIHPPNKFIHLFLQRSFELYARWAGRPPVVNGVCYKLSFQEEEKQKFLVFDPVRNEKNLNNVYLVWLFFTYLTWRIKTYNSLGPIKNLYFVAVPLYADYTTKVVEEIFEQDNKKVSAEMEIVKIFLAEHGLTCVDDYELFCASNAGRTNEDKKNAVVNQSLEYAPETFIGNRTACLKKLVEMQRTVFEFCLPIFQNYCEAKNVSLSHTAIVHPIDADDDDEMLLDEDRTTNMPTTSGAAFSKTFVAAASKSLEELVTHANSSHSNFKSDLEAFVRVAKKLLTKSSTELENFFGEDLSLNEKQPATPILSQEITDAEDEICDYPQISTTKAIDHPFSVAAIPSLGPFSIGTPKSYEIPSVLNMSTSNC